MLATSARRPGWRSGKAAGGFGRTKKQLRTIILRQLRQQEEEERRRTSDAIRRKVFRLTAFRRARIICCYVALPYEVQTWRMMEQMLSKGKRVVVPVTQPRAKRLQMSEVHDLSADLRPGRFGVWEPRRGARRPVPLRDIHLVLVPGLAFDRRGHRLGHGHGYFDRLLSRMPDTTPTIGLAFRFQLLDRLPTTPHDYAVRQVLTA